ncbi:MAG: acyl-protein synthetase [Armatimonadota bacterium]
MSTELIFNREDVFLKNEKTDRLFLESIKETVNFHYNNSPFYRNLCNQNNFNPSKIKKEKDIVNIPYIFVDVLKQYKLLSVPEKNIIFELASSGTKGTVSRIMWDKLSMYRHNFMRQQSMRSLGLVSDKKAHYVMFTYDYDQSKGRGAAYAHYMYSVFAPAIDRYYALRKRKKGEDFTFDINEAGDYLKKAAESGEPVRIIGFPSFTYFTVRKLMEKHKKLPLHPESLVINGGGWKLHTGDAILKDEYRNLLSSFFCIPESRIRDVFGMVEHGVPYISCPEGNFHELVYSKILVRDPLTEKIMPNGSEGLLQFITPYIRSMPSFNILSSDLGYISKSKCKCGIKRPYFTILRRAGTTLYKGCALTASEYLK